MNSPVTPRRRRGGYFPVEEGSPGPVVVRISHRVRFSDVDLMGVLWHGRYANLFEQANEEIGRVCGLTYEDFKKERLGAPVVQLHVDYFAPVKLAERVTIVGKMIWTQGARVNIEYEILRETGELAATGYTVQMFIEDDGTPLMASPPLHETCCRRWLSGEFGGRA